LSRGEAPWYGSRHGGSSKLQRWRGFLRARLEAYAALTAIPLFREITELGYEGGYTAAKEYGRQERPKVKPIVELRFETPEGRQAQADFGVFEAFFEGGARRGAFPVQHIGTPMGDVIRHNRDLAISGSSTLLHRSCLARRHCNQHRRAAWYGMAWAPA
jgi:hypothetical protein